MTKVFEVGWSRWAWLRHPIRRYKWVRNRRRWVDVGDWLHEHEETG